MINPQAILLVLSLIERATAAAIALQGVTKAFAQAKAEGREVTLDDFKSLELGDDAARKVLVDAINAAE